MFLKKIVPSWLRMLQEQAALPGVTSAITCMPEDYSLADHTLLRALNTKLTTISPPFPQKIMT